MLEKKIIVNNKTGLHARPAGELTKLSSKFQSSIQITFDNKVVNTKSIMSILSSCIKGGSEIMLHICGDDEELAFGELTKFFENLTD